MKRKKGDKRFAIGVFDSGFGGLDIMKGIVRSLPAYNYVYLGDSARNPYGTRSPELIYHFTRQAVQFLFNRGCWLVILACNTASSSALRRLQQEYLPCHYPDRRVLGVIIPTAEMAALKSRRRRIGVMATEATVLSNNFKKELEKIDPKIKVFQQACPLLVPFVECGRHNHPACADLLAEYLKPLIKKNIDTLIPGCTHYGLLEKTIKQKTGRKIRVISQSRIVGEKLKDYLQRHPEIAGRLKKDGRINFYTTDLTDKFILLGSRFFGQPLKADKTELL